MGTQNREWTRISRIIDRIVGCATLGSPSPHPSPLGRGRMLHRRSIRPVPGFTQQPSAKHQPLARCSLSPRERVRVRGNNSVAFPNCRITQSLLCNTSGLDPPRYSDPGLGRVWSRALEFQSSKGSSVASSHESKASSRETTSGRAASPRHRAGAGLRPLFQFPTCRVVP
jgi:hypothetical protein